MSNPYASSQSLPADSTSTAEVPSHQIPLGISLSVPGEFYESASSSTERQVVDRSEEGLEKEPLLNISSASIEVRAHETLDSEVLSENGIAPAEATLSREAEDSDVKAVTDEQQRPETENRESEVGIPEENESGGGSGDDVDEGDGDVDGGGDEGGGGADDAETLSPNSDEQRDRFGDTDIREPQGFELLRESTSRFGSLLRRPQLHHQHPNDYRHRRSNNNSLLQKQREPMSPRSMSQLNRRGPLPPLAGVGQQLQQFENGADYSTYRSGGMLFLRRHSLIAINRFACL